MRTHVKTFRLFLAAAGLAMCAPHAARADDPNALWKIISDRCLPAFEQHKPPDPCAAVDLTGGIAHGFVVLKDRNGATQFLLMPTAKITGSESPEILAPDATNYFADAWLERGRMDARAGHKFPRDDVSLAVNSITGRTQNQLHIHIDCVSAEVRSALRAHQAAVGDKWAPFPVTLAGHHYLAMRVTGEDLGTANPFKLVAEGIPGAASDMGHQSIAVVGTVLPDGKPGFIILDTHTDAATGNFASSEELQDHSCRGL